MSTLKILISDPVAERCLSNLRQNNFEVHYEPGLSPEELLEIVGNYHGLIVRSATNVTADVIHRAKNLKVIGRAGTGVDNIDVEAATENCIAVLNSKGGNTISAAEHTFALMIALARNIAVAQASMSAGKWERGAFTGVELFGKKLGIVGLGQIGKEVAKRAKAFGMNICAFDPLLSSDEFTSLGIEQLDLEGLFMHCDFITLHLPLNENTRHLIGEKQFEISKRNLRIINVARGGIVDEGALYDALKTDKIAGAALDVFEKEPPGDNPLIGLKNVITTPHLGASTVDAQERIAEAIAEGVADFLQNKNVDSIVNPEVLQA